MLAQRARREQGHAARDTRKRTQTRSACCTTTAAAFTLKSPFVLENVAALRMTRK